MPAAKQWALTNLGQGVSLALEVDFGGGVVELDIAQFTATWAVNEIPSAQCMLAIGRDVRDLNIAPIHANASRLRQMQKCRVIFRPKGEYKPDGTKWPDEFVIFVGYLVGMAYHKLLGKVQVIANLKHWLVDLACSSCLTGNTHPLNPSHLTARAVMDSLNEEGASESHYVSNLPATKLIQADIISDVWGGIKKLFCGLADMEVVLGFTEQEGSCGGTGAALKNERAKQALSRIEGPGDSCSLDYEYGVPLKLDVLGIQDAQNAVAKAIAEDSIESYAHTTFWDKLVGDYCKSFYMAVCPSVEFALVVADTPAFNGGPWQTLEPSEYDSFQMQADIERPLRAVGVTVQFGSNMGLPESAVIVPTGVPTVKGCFVDEDADDPDNGVILYTAAPRWLQCMFNYELYAGGTSGLRAGQASKTDTTPDAVGGDTPPTTGTIVNELNELLGRYAHSVFAANTLRGRAGIVSGKLRFDIAPGSIIKIKGNEEKFIGGEDELATSMVGAVSRVTVAINAENAMAGTTFVLSHLRTEAENSLPRTSVSEHPLFLKAIHGFGRHGSPLVAEHEAL